ncbi:hypothetical protein X797_011782 [Metarhizium robertsii]|uniref:Uncharacterized protein n=1 Tax=Metarhizium robertsii TaxID=568076 RepID=A0A014N625_9HYPO|nr:hypothetical protein X797_011782 [Metarhizium robertsii]
MKTFVSVVALFGALAASMPQGPLSASPTVQELTEKYNGNYRVQCQAANGRLECKTYELVDQYHDICGTCEYGPGPKLEDWFLEQFHCELKH